MRRRSIRVKIWGVTYLERFSGFTSSVPWLRTSTHEVSLSDIKQSDIKYQTIRYTDIKQSNIKKPQRKQE
jgi:hypothetical protein